MNIGNYLTNVNGTRFAVYISALMLCFSSILRLLWIHFVGHDDTLIIQFQSAMVTLFTGSIAIDRAQIHQKAKEIEKNGNGHTVDNGSNT